MKSKIHTLFIKNIFVLIAFVTGVANAQIVYIPDANFKTYLQTLNGLDENSDGEIQVSEAAMWSNFGIDVPSNVSDVTGIEAFTSIYGFQCSNNTLITQIDLSSNTLLQDVLINITSVSSLNISGLTNLLQMDIRHTQIVALDASGISVVEFNVTNNSQLTSINVTGITNLYNFDCANNPLLTTLDITTLTELELFECYYNQLTTLDFSNCPLLELIMCNNNQLTTLDISNCPNVDTLYFRDNPVTTVFAKNGREEFLFYNLNSDLTFICVDDSQIESVQAELITDGMTGVNVASYCSFTPGGDYNTINGTVRFDLNNDGCDVSDMPSNFVRIGIDDGTATGTSFTNNSGNYSFYTQSGNFSVTPAMENSSYFTFSPPNATVNFPLVDNSVSVNDFCISANGIHPDVEVVIAPVAHARPGFDATYKIVYKNKGNQTQSGTVTLTFNGAVLDFTSSNPSPTTQASNFISFDYTNLLPFENRQILITLNVNTPTDVPPVNIGDTLNFTATINPISGDENVNDNLFSFNQTVVGSYDPNDKTCLEGDSVAPNEIGNYLHYIINFENTGTAPATNVVVKDIINTAQFDINTLQVMNASHPVEIKITGNIIEFIFQNINLPSAISDPIGGHGNVLFKIRTLPTLPSGTMVSNTANIYFDYNFPIETNEARTTFESLSKADFVKDNGILIYPNPTNGLININSESAIKTILLFDIQGRILQTTIDQKNTAALDISDKSDGIYFIKITTDKGSKVEKIIKE